MPDRLPEILGPASRGRGIRVRLGKIERGPDIWGILAGEACVIVMDISISSMLWPEDPLILYANPE